jgi:hypothetical protein
LKIVFGIDYVKESLRTRWDTYCGDHRKKDPTWSATWNELKSEMLNALGTPAERRQAAYQALKDCRQKPRQTPSELLQFMSPLWEELGDMSADIKVIEFTAALSDPVKRDLSLLPYEMRATLSQVEEQANVIQRRLTQSKSDHSGLSKGQRKKRESDEKLEPSKAPKSARKGQKGPGRFAKSRNDGDTKIICYNCNEEGHTRPRCPLLRGKDEPSTAKDKSGKGKGRGN